MIFLTCSKKKAVFFLSLFFWLTISYVSQAQTIQWNNDLKVSHQSAFLKNDSTEQNLRIFTDRSFLLDSLQMLAPENPYKEKVYTLSFANPQQAAQIVLPMPQISRLMIYIKLVDMQGKDHLVYEYGATPLCLAGQQIMVLNIPPTLYKVKAMEIGLFADQHFLNKAGIAYEKKADKLIKELLLNGNKDICIQSSYLSDKYALSAGINSEYDEAKPLISPDGKTLIFARQNHPDNKGKKRDAQDIYFTQWDGKQWQDAENIGKPLNNKASNGAASITPDGNKLLLINEYLSENEIAAGVSYSQKTLEGWSFPKTMEIEDFHNYSEYVDYYLTASQKEMLMAVERDDSEGDQDLYVSFYNEKNQTWGKPINLGPTINTFLGETSPFLAADGVSLYFASEGHLGQGGFDIYYSRRLDDSWTRWSEPENLGPVINSFEDDFYYAIPASGDFAYFISKEKGSKDIYRIGLPKQFRPEPVVLLSGTIFDMKHFAPAEAHLIFRDAVSGSVVGESDTDPKTGEYKVVLPVNGAFEYTIDQKDNSLKKYNINTLDQKKYTEIERNHLTGLEENKQLLLINSDKTDSKAYLKRAAELLGNFPALSLRISGMELSDSLLSPAQAYHYLLDKKVKAEQLTYLDKEIQQGKLQLRFEYDRNLAPDYVLTEEVLQRVKEIADTKETHNNAVVLFEGQVFDAQTLRPVEADVAYQSVSKRGKSGIASTDPFSGKYQVILPAGDKYILSLRKKGFKAYQAEIDLTEVNSFEEKTHHLVLQPKEEQQGPVSFTLGHHLYENLTQKDREWVVKQFYKRKSHKQYASFGVTHENMPEEIRLDLEHIARFMQLNPGSSIRMVSYDSKKNAIDMTRKRAQLCKEFLTEQGIAANRISLEAKGYDDTHTRFFFWRKRNLRIEAFMELEQPAVQKENTEGVN